MNLLQRNSSVFLQFDLLFSDEAIFQQSFDFISNLFIKKRNDNQKDELEDFCEIDDRGEDGEIRNSVLPLAVEIEDELC